MKKGLLGERGRDVRTETRVDAVCGLDVSPFLSTPPEQEEDGRRGRLSCEAGGCGSVHVLAGPDVLQIIHWLKPMKEIKITY